LFVVMVQEYEANAQQILLLTALVSMDTRCEYEERVLVRSEYMSPEESERLMSRIPLLDITKSRNVVGFWNLRDYVLLDRSNNRVGMEILISMGVLVIVLNIVLGFYDLYTLPYISPTIPVVVFDLVIMGVLILYSLNQALLMNIQMSSHAQIFNQATHDINLRMADFMLQAETFIEGEKHNKEVIADLKMAKKVLHSATTIVKENDTRESLLFGFEVTPGMLIQAATGLLSSGGYFMFMMFKTGKNPLEQYGVYGYDKEAAAKSVKFLAQYAASKFW